MAGASRVVCLVLGLSPLLAGAQGKEPPLSQWQHSEWTGDAGPPRHTEGLMRRTPDGYLWMSGSGGVLRFDGVRFTVIDSTNTPALRVGGRPGADALFAPQVVDRSGVLWITGPNGMVVSYAAGTFRVVVPAGARDRGSIAEDGAGRLWLYNARLWGLQSGTVAPAQLPPGVPDTGIFGVTRDTGTGVWIGTNHQGLWHVTGATAQHYEHYGSGRIRALLQSADGTLLATGEGLGVDLWQLHHGAWSVVRAPNGVDPINARSAVEGSDGWVWLPTNDQGLLRWRRGVVEAVTSADGLSDDAVYGVLPDAEGPVWAVTAAGLDRLRPSAFVSIEPRHHAPYESGSSFAVDTVGRIWSIAPGGRAVYVLDDGPIRNRPGPITARRYAVGISTSSALLTASRAGGVWLAPFTGGLLQYTERGVHRFGAGEGLPPQRVEAGLEARDGTLWVRVFGGALGRLRGGRYRRIPLAGAPNGHTFLEDGAGRLWFGDRTRGVVFVVAGDSVVAEVALPRQNDTWVMSLALAGADTVWAAGTRSLYRIVDRRAVEVRVPMLTAMLDPGVTLAVAHGSLWLAGSLGVARVALADLNRVADGARIRITPVTFGALDGLASTRASSRALVRMRVASDGRLWLATLAGLAVTDPARVVGNPVVPHVHIEDVSVDGVTRAGVNDGTIPPNPDRVDIRFAAPSLGLPERMRVEYRLDGADTRWIDGTPPRVATYRQLRPGTYRFRVRAWNEDGVPSAGEATLRFRVLPAWYQAWWFVGLCALGVSAISGGLAAAIQRRRGRRLAREADARFDAVLAERTRMARELHDTLLQGFTGITLQLDGVRDSLEARSELLANDLSTILHRADRTLREAREMVWDMRQPASHLDDLSEALRLSSRDVARAAGIDVQHTVEGLPRRLPPMVVTTLLRIGKEAVVNALQHAHPTAVVVHLTYAPRQVLLEIRDDGRGAEATRIETATVRGHWGVAGMHERARAAGGTVIVTSAPHAGTQVRVSLPAEPIA